MHPTLARAADAPRAFSRSALPGVWMTALSTYSEAQACLASMLPADVERAVGSCSSGSASSATRRL
jgi:hypothetical protein